MKYVVQRKSDILKYTVHDDEAKVKQFLSDLSQVGIPKNSLILYNFETKEELTAF